MANDLPVKVIRSFEDATKNWEWLSDFFSVEVNVGSFVAEISSGGGGDFLEEEIEHGLSGVPDIVLGNNFDLPAQVPLIDDLNETTFNFNAGFLDNGTYHLGWLAARKL